MRGVDVLAMQLRGSCELIVTRSRDAGDWWDRRALPETSRPGFILWHCARIVDWGVNTVVRGVAEVAAAEEWRDRVRHDLGHGAGLSDAEADSVAASVGPEDLAAYAEVLTADVGGWIGDLDDAALDAVPDLRAACATHPRYATASAWDEVEGLAGLPAWQVLARPCINHIRVHIGEFDTLVDALRRGLDAGGG